MKVIFGISLFFLPLLFISCNNKVGKNHKVLNTEFKDSVNAEASRSLKMDKKNSADIYFKATGTEPFWGLEISENRIKLTTIGDSIITPHTNSIRAMDANVKLYKTQTESSLMNIQISQSGCTNAMSGNVSPYSVSIYYKKNNENDLIELQGCGNYITDYRLHDIWVLEKLKGSVITKSDFSKEFPRIEINSTTKTFLGFAGCNRMNGSIFFENKLLRFTNIVTTKMMCEPSNKEPEFLKALQSSTIYKIENNRLSLSNPDGELLVFKKNY